ncbi:phospho-N-acetylmuramoyl-pentapeptide-transferase [Desulfohalovibrio reitneri]|uniref:phospho-N-acetylmuramoyl-pentapeptide- transferase n=1 Tax=Desulfohalovibrio reitneri TaxID=1307759 RepID=UPI0004A75728|nr:phospho-N-acetylmuramoyl-pentapeptide-transferase [Desulfohalovibrio reitneri]
MIYNLLYPLSDQIGVFNVFRYITFRSIYAFLTALVIAIFVGPMIIRWLQKLKFGQYIQEDVAAHRSKAGTPTMGGILIMAGTLPATLLWADLTNSHIWLTLLVFVGFGAVGFWDDYLKVCRKMNKGLSAKVKFLAQVLVASLAMALLVGDPAYSTKLAVPFFKDILPNLFIFYIPFAVLVMVGSSNGVNLTDGLDGLAIVPTVVAAVVFGIFVYVAGNVKLAEYLQVPYVVGVGEAAVFCSALLGAGLGFLWYNAYPAQVFMGDVGSLALGGSLGFVSVLAKQELLLLVVGGLFVIETLSVIVQVGYFKMTGGKRIFRMAPLHHHFEMKGIPESKIIIRFWIISVLFALVALSTLKLR